jgi:hypothetical protein
MFKIVITSPDGTKNTVDREGVMVEFPTHAKATDTASWMRDVYPHFTFVVEAI